MSKAWALVALAFFLATLARTVTEVDAGELATVATTLGIAHPSGYPLFTLVGRVVVLGVAALRPILAMNLLSALFAAAAVGMVARCVEDLLAAASPSRPKPAPLIGAGVGALAFAFHSRLWSVATVTEVHALQMFLNAALLHALVRAGFWDRRPFRERAWLVACYCGGLCLTNHLTSALLLPAFLWGTWQRRRFLNRRLLVRGSGLALLGVSPYLFLPLRALHEPFLNWGAPHHWEAFLRHVTGAQYRVWMFGSSDALMQNAVSYARDLTQGFPLPLLLVALIGLIRGRRLPGFLPSTLMMFVFTTVYPLGYDVHDVAQYFLTPFLIVAIWIGVGAAALAAAIIKAGPRPQVAWALLALPLVSAGLHYREADRAHDHWVDSMARAFLATPHPNSVVLTANWDVLLSPALYLQQVENVRPDLVLLDQEFFRRTWMLPHLQRWQPELLQGLTEEAQALQAQLTVFEKGEPYEAAQIQAAFETVLSAVLANGARRGGAYVGQEIEPGIAAGKLRIPDGLLFRLENPLGAAELAKAAPWPEFPAQKSARSGPGTHLFEARRYAARMALASAGLAERLGEPQRAADDRQRALSWEPPPAPGVQRR